jgi:branched-subunit amino acid transport protein
MNGELWLLFGAAGLLTFLIRLSFIAAEGRFRAPAWFVAALPFVPIAALTALVAPELLLQAGSLHLGPRFWAGLVAIGVAAWKRHTLLTIASGFAALWLFSSF